MSLQPISAAVKGPALRGLFPLIQRNLGWSAALKMITMQSQGQVNKKAVDNMRSTLQNHLEGHQQLDQVRRTKECYMRAQLGG